MQGDFFVTRRSGHSAYCRSTLAAVPPIWTLRSAVNLLLTQPARSRRCPRERMRMALERATCRPKAEMTRAQKCTALLPRVQGKLPAHYQPEVCTISARMTWNRKQSSQCSPESAHAEKD